MKSDKLIRVSDKVKVIKPDFFVRCGYPMDLDEETNKVLKEFGKDVFDIMQKVGVKDTFKQPLNYHILTSFKKEQSSRSMMKICREIAYAKCKSNKFGGNQRQIYTQSVPEFQGQVFTVCDTKIVKTGTYIPASFYNSYGDGDEYEPPELCKQKTHKILKVSRNSMWIEAVNVEKCL